MQQVRVHWVCFHPKTILSGPKNHWRTKKILYKAHLDHKQQATTSRTSVVLVTPHESCGNMIINSIWNMVIDFFSVLLDVIHTNSANQAGKQISLVNCPKSLFEGKSLDADRQGMHMQSQRKPVRNVLQTAWRHSALRFTVESFWVRNKLSSIDRCCDVPQFGKTSRNHDQLILMHSYLHEHNTILDTCCKC